MEVEKKLWSNGTIISLILPNENNSSKISVKYITIIQIRTNPSAGNMEHSSTDTVLVRRPWTEQKSTNRHHRKARAALKPHSEIQFQDWCWKKTQCSPNHPNASSSKTIERRPDNTRHMADVYPSFEYSIPFVLPHPSQARKTDRLQLLYIAIRQTNYFFLDYLWLHDRGPRKFYHGDGKGRSISVHFCQRWWWRWCEECAKSCDPNCLVYDDVPDSWTPRKHPEYLWNIQERDLPLQ